MKKQKTIHFVGIKGVGMTPLAIIAKEAGFIVSGCDIDQDFITDNALNHSGIIPFIGFSSSHLKNIDLIITTGAHGGFDNEEVKEAKKQNIKIITQGEAVGLFMEGSILGRKNQIGISIAGSHGKTTTTAMIATILKENKMDPSFLIGTGNISSLGEPGHFGKGKFFVAEADEYSTEPTHDKKVKFLWQHPQIAIFTNIEMDHPDLYSSVDQIRNEFLSFANQLPPNGLLIANGDDRELKKLLSEYKGRVIKFGYSSENDYILRRVSVSGTQTFFWVESGGTNLGEFSIQVFGEHNAVNALSAAITGIELGLNVQDIKKGLSKFKGSERRAEFIGTLESGALLYDDYAHHPTEIKKTLKAFKQSFPNLKIVCIFQPHTFSRTKILFDEFVHSFSDADTIVIIDVYPSLREKSDFGVSSRMLVESVKKFHPNAVFLSGIKEASAFINEQKFNKNTVVITMGAGDVYKIKDRLNLHHEEKV